MELVKARVLDSTHVELLQPISAAQGQTVFVTIAEFGDEDIERQQWLAFAASCLESAYGDSEPDYTPSMVRETNPGYGK